MGVGRPWKGSLGSPWILKFLVKKIVFLILSWKKFHHLLPLIEKFQKNPLVAP